MLVRSIYVPEYCLQLEKFPSHILWNKDDNLSIVLTLPKNIELVNLYNVPADGIELPKENTLKLTKFYENGYVGFVFKTIAYDEPSVTEEIIFSITNGDYTEQHSKKILLFRQNLKIISVPDIIRIKYDETKNKHFADEKIRIKNIGSGIAIIESNINETTSIKIKPPIELLEFINKFIKSIQDGMVILSEEFPNYSSEISEFSDILSFRETKDIENRFKNVMEKIEAIINVDKDFLEALSTKLSIAYYQNTEMLTEIELFKEYLKSSESGKILLQNSIENISFPSNTDEKVDFQIIITDMAHNTYPSIDLPSIRVISTEESSIPLYDLFEFCQQESQEMKEIRGE